MTRRQRDRYRNAGPGQVEAQSPGHAAGGTGASAGAFCDIVHEKIVGDEAFYRHR
jgi:hypothetical protein